MDVNDIFTQIGNFWDRISVPILFHIIFFWLAVFIFGKFSIKTSIEEYIQSDAFTRTKAILKEFELWTKLPLILIVLALIYLTLFNSVTGLIGSIRVFPFTVAYSNQDFLKEYEPEENIIKIARYGKDTVPDLSKVDELRERLLEEYKGKYPDKYDSWVKWTKNRFGDQNRKFNLTCLIVIALFISLIVRLFQKKKTKKIQSLVRYVFVLGLIFPVLFLFRYREEQNIEETFSNETMFVKSSLEFDPSRKILLDSMQVSTLEKRLSLELKNERINQPQLWVSRIVGRSEILQNILGRRKLRNIVSRNNDYLQ